ncbi:ABC-type transport auxiliary lipoprotein family protein [Thermodesulfobacteriota bacterium]
MCRLKKMSVLLLFLSLLFGACLNLKQPRNRIEYYTLEYAPPPITGIKPLPYAIRVERFTVAPVFNSTQIIYRDQSFKRNAYAYYKWRVNPGDLVTYFLNRDIMHSGLFKAVLPHGSRSVSSYTLEGSVDEFFEWDTEESWSGVLSISITLITTNEPDISKKILFQKSYRTTESCKLKHPRALAEAISMAMARISEKIIKDIHNHLKDMR